jgi:hypothetical protein
LALSFDCGQICFSTQIHATRLCLRRHMQNINKK